LHQVELGSADPVQLNGCKTLVAIYWMHLRVNQFPLSLFARKKTITTPCSLPNNFSGNVTLFNVYKCKIARSQV